MRRKHRLVQLACLALMASLQFAMPHRAQAATNHFDCGFCTGMVDDCDIEAGECADDCGTQGVTYCETGDRRCAGDDIWVDCGPG